MFTTMFQAFFEAIAKGFSYGEEKVDKQCETDVLKNKKKLVKTTEKQADLILDMTALLLKYVPQMSKDDRRKADKYIKKVKGIN